MMNEYDDENATMSITQYRESLELRPDYEHLRVREWTRDECLKWLLDEGCFDCGMNYCSDAELRSEVLIQKASLGE